MGLSCKETGRRHTAISVIMLGGILCAVMLAYMAFGDNNDERGLRNLRMIFILFRHGARSPTDTYPKDSYLNYEWPGGKGALSEKGAVQLYNLGKNLRMRYYRLLPQNGLYSQEEMTVLSSYAERCIMSAQSLLAGFVPPLENRNALPIPWQPIPVNVIPRDRDTLIAQTKTCPKYDAILQKLYINPPLDVKKMNDENRDLYEMLTKRTGKNISTILHVELLYNTLDIEKSAGLELPDWTEDIFPDKMQPFTERSYTLFTDTPYMKKIKGGAFITEIVNNMINKRRNSLKPDRKIYLYAGHDVSLVNVMNSLNILNQTSRKPDYASALVFEVHHSFTYDDDFEVKLVYYYNAEDKFPKEINIPNCSYPCSLTQFNEAMKYLLLDDDFDKLCESIPKLNTTCTN